MALGIEDLAVGHWTDPVGLTGCTVVVPPPDNVAAASVRGGGPGTRETDLLQPQAHVESVSAILLTGGSAFGLAAAQGVVAWCERQGLGYGRFGPPIPIVPAAVLFDLAVGDWQARPGPAEGEAACLAAATADGPMGNVGAGMGATVGKTAGPERMMKGGLGWAVVETGPLVVGALAAVNAKTEVHRVAVQAHDGMARAVRPVHTSFDGDTVFALAVPRVEAVMDLVAFLAEEALAAAIRAGVRAAAAVADIPAASDLGRGAGGE